MLKNNADDNIIIIDKVTPKNKQENKKCPNISYIAKTTINTEKTNMQTNYDNEPINNNKRIRHNFRHRKNKINKNRLGDNNLQKKNDKDQAVKIINNLIDTYSDKKNYTQFINDTICSIEEITGFNANNRVQSMDNIEIPCTKTINDCNLLDEISVSININDSEKSKTSLINMCTKYTNSNSECKNTINMYAPINGRTNIMNDNVYESCKLHIESEIFPKKSAADIVKSFQQKWKNNSAFCRGINACHN